MKTSQAAVDRLLDASNTSVTLATLGKAARALGRKIRLNWLRRERRSYGNSLFMRDLTAENRKSRPTAVNDMRIEGFSISEERAMELARQALAKESPRHPDRRRRSSNRFGDAFALLMTFPPAVKERRLSSSCLNLLPLWIVDFSA